MRVRVWLPALLGLMAHPVFASAAAQAAGGVGIIAGTVQSSTGTPIVGAEVFAQGTRIRATTGEDGSFRLSDLPHGTIVLTTRRLGYSPVNRSVLVRTEEVTRVEILLRVAPVAMQPIQVSARREPADSRLAGFRQRAEQGSSGHIITRERIERSANRSVLDIMRSVPGVRVNPGARGGGQARTVRFRSNRCPPVVFIDGFAASAAEFDLESVDLNMVEGIEVYMSSTSLPPEFFAVARGLEQCGVIAIWSRPAQPRPPRARPREAAESAPARDAAKAANEVDEIAYILGGALEVIYPDSLWRTATEGQVRLEFVVDARGRLDWSTLVVQEESHPYFGQAVLAALAGVSWEAAKLNGRRVPQLVILPVQFVR